MAGALAAVAHFQREALTSTGHPLTFGNQRDEAAVLDEERDARERGRDLDGLALAHALAGIEVVPASRGQHDLARLYARRDGRDKQSVAEHVLVFFFVHAADGIRVGGGVEPPRLVSRLRVVTLDELHRPHHRRTFKVILREGCVEVWEQTHTQEDGSAYVIFHFRVRPELVIGGPAVEERERRDDDVLRAPKHLFAFSSAHLRRPEHAREAAVADRRDVLVEGVVVVIDDEGERRGARVRAAHLAHRAQVALAEEVIDETLHEQSVGLTQLLAVAAGRERGRVGPEVTVVTVNFINLETADRARIDADDFARKVVSENLSGRGHRVVWDDAVPDEMRAGVG